MKLNINWTLLISAILLGVVIGYFIFGRSSSPNRQDTEPLELNELSAQEEIWTCSMHPSVRQQISGKCPICGMDLILLDLKSSDDPLVLEMTAEAVKLAQIQTTIVGGIKDQVSRSIRLSGRIIPDERFASSQVAHIPGRIESLFVTFTGEEVKAGQKLAEIYSPELITAQRELIEGLKMLELNPALAESAKNKLRNWKIDDDTINEIEETGEIRETFTLLADETGVVINRRISVGDYVKQGEPLFDLVRLDKLWVTFDAYESDLPYIKRGDIIEFTVASLRDKEFKSEITFIDPLINPVSRVASVRTEVNNVSGILKPDMFVTGNLEGHVLSSNILWVPKSAVLWTGTRSVVYVKVPGTEIPSYMFQEITLGTDLGREYEVIKGLRDGDEVVTNGAFSIDAAAQLNNQSSMMNRGVSIKGIEKSDIPDYKKSTPTGFATKLGIVIAGYMDLKNAFVASHSETVSAYAADLVLAIENVDMNLLEGMAQMYWMDISEALISHATQIEQSDEIDFQRKQFDFLSQNLLSASKAFRWNGESVYIMYCPMAFENQGAKWLSEETIIKNPYFGDKMLKCGKVEQTIEPGN